MGIYLNPGNEAFRTIRNSRYIDKSGLLNVLNSMINTGRKLVCMSRPRRFGKSYAAKMMCAYYDCTCDSSSLFADLEIASSPSYDLHRGKYHVICLDITNLIGDAGGRKEAIDYLKDHLIKEIAKAYPETGTHDSLTSSLLSLVEKTGRKIIMIIDEWDALLRESRLEDKWRDDYIDLLRALFKSTGTTDRIFAAAYMTGILPVKKYGRQSAVSDFKEYTFMDPGPFAEFVGFLDHEVRSLCDEYDMDYEDAKRWYDGYSFDTVPSVYNPNSIMEAMYSKRYASYWNRSDTYKVLEPYIRMDFDGLRESIAALIGGAEVRVDVNSFQNDMAVITNRDDVLSLFIHLGYLGYHINSKSAFIPNYEIREELIGAAGDSRTELARVVNNSSRLLRDTLLMDEESVASCINDVHDSSVSPLDYNDEKSLRYCIRFAYITCIDEYVRIEELPSGHGYADVVFLPKKGIGKPAMVVELKWNRQPEAAIAQIRDRNYPQILKDYGGEILLVGITYDAATKTHSCKIEKTGR